MIVSASRARILGACLLALIGSQPVAGQDSALMNPGARVRYWLPEMSRPVEAEVIRWSTDRMRVRLLETGDTLEPRAYGVESTGGKAT